MRQGRSTTIQMHTESFYQNSASAAGDQKLQSRLRVLNTFNIKRAAAFAELADGEDLRDRARRIKQRTIDNLDRYLLKLEESVTRLGGTVHWARDGAEARAIILEIARTHNVKRVVKSKSMATEEIELNDAFEAAGIEPVETDLGEYIVQLAHEKPSHILAPAIHKSKGDISELFAERLGGERLEEAEELTRLARGQLREKFCSAEMGVTGANFGVAETGTIVLVENEGNIRLSTTLPRVHVALMGIEKVIPKLDELAVFLKILARSAAGQKMSSYVSFITGARRAGESDGAQEFHLVILDNGRTNILADPEKRESLYCLRCGACLNICPVYQKIGGHAYGSVYSGPIGSIITPPMAGIQNAKDLPFASSLCGACREVCPVRINIPHILLKLRSEWVEDKREDGSGPPLFERAAMKIWLQAMSHRVSYNLLFRTAARFQGPLLENGKLNRLPPPFSAWTESRDFPPLARKSFRQMWKEMEKRASFH
ncbi:MAG TPA: LutB/LldF family L-lactate oxidation iron-sulfur protein [Blastocatellia bacterium]|nr:LutB/LldF family L-lactate oxidation iron-sulfur protein [Blastocatellia bacterium]